MFRTLLAATSLSLSVTFSAAAHAQSSAPPRMISLTGHGEVRLAPDLATVSAGVLSQAVTAKDALAANTASMTAVLAALKSAGIAERDIQTSNFNVQPRYDYNNEGRAPTLVGYDVSNSVTVTVRKLDTLGTVLDHVVGSGSNQINGIYFGIDRPEAALDQARKLAVADARRKADLYAGAARVTLGNMLSLSESGGFSPPPVHMQSKMVRAEAMSDAVPIAQGEQVLAIDVNIAWEIK